MRSNRRGLVEALNHAMRASSGLGVVFGAAVAERLGISHRDLECLDVVAMRGRATAGELATATGLTTGAITGVIDRLEEAGFAHRERDADDRRKVHVVLSKKARGFGAAYYGPLEESVNRLIERYSDAELALMIDFFERSREVMLREIEKLERKAATRRTKPAAKALRPS